MSELLPAGHPFAGLRRNFYRCFLIDPPTDFSAGKKTRPQHYLLIRDTAVEQLQELGRQIGLRPDARLPTMSNWESFVEIFDDDSADNDDGNDADAGAGQA